MSDRAHLIELATGNTRVVLDLVAGGRLSQITVGDEPLLWTDKTFGAIGWGSYPMAPWVGRIRAGQFEFDGTRYQLLLDHQDTDGTRHAIHGTVYSRPWILDGITTTDAELHCNLGSWPWAGAARQRFELTGDGLRCELSVEASTASFPAAVGWHPWFLKPDRLTFSPTHMYRRGDIGLPTAELVAPAPGPWDDTFLNDRPVTLHYDAPSRQHARSVTVTSDCDHWVLYDKPRHATCVEPQSGPPDAPNMKPELVTPDAPLTRWMHVGWS